MVWPTLSNIYFKCMRCIRGGGEYILPVVTEANKMRNKCGGAFVTTQLLTMFNVQLTSPIFGLGISIIFQAMG